MLEPVLKGQRLLRLSHSIVSVDRIDFARRQLEVTGEYHIRLSNAEVSSSGLSNQKVLGIGFLLPDGNTEVHSVSLNGRPVPGLSPLDDLENVSRFDLSYWAFPEGASSEAMGRIFARVCENRRDLVSFEEISKAHKSASLNQSFGLLVKVPPLEVVNDQSLSLIVKIVVNDSPVFKSFLDSDICLTTIGQEIWFPLPSRLMVLPSGSPVTSQPMEHQRHKFTIKVPTSQIPNDMHCVCSGDKVPSSSELMVFESSWLNPKSAGILMASFTETLEETSVFRAFTFGPHAPYLRPTLKGDVVSEIVQVLAPWFASPTQLLPQLNLVFLPLPERKSFLVYGNTLLVDSEILHGEGMTERQMQARVLLAEAIAALWVERVMPAFAEPWIPVGISTMLADRFVEFHLGTNEYQYRIIQRRQKFHSLVERGQDWRPLSVIGEPNDPLLLLKAPLVIDCLRRGITGDSDLRSAFHELATISGGKKGPWTSESFLFLITCTVGQHTEAGKAIPAFKEEWIRSVGVPIIHIGFSMLEKRRFALHVSQRPLQKVMCHDMTPLCSTNQARGSHFCSCGQDYIARSTEQQEGTISCFMRSHHVWPPTVKRRFWNGDIQVSIFRSSSHFVPVTIKMDVDSPDGTTEYLTVPYVTPRKHEQHLNRALRDDELVHGFMTVMDDRWMLAKVIVCQSPLMWCNMLHFGRNVVFEQSAIEALQHVRGSALVQEALQAVLQSPNQYFWRTRIDAGRGLVHMAIGCAEREALQTVIGWMGKSIHSETLSDVLTWSGIGEYLSMLKRNTDQRDQPAIAQLFASSVQTIEQNLAIGAKEWGFDPSVLLANTIKFALMTATNIEAGSTLFRAIDTRLRSDLYGPPLASVELSVSEAVISASLIGGPFLMKLWPFLLDPKFLEQHSISAHRKLSRIALRSFLALVGTTGMAPDSEEAWLVRFIWIEKLTKQIIANQALMNVQTTAWLVDCWEVLAERARKETIKSPFGALFQRTEMCDKVWKYLTEYAVQLPQCVRSSISMVVHGMYMHIYGTGVPGPYRANLDDPNLKGPLSFWLPLKDHERVYRRFIYRGTTVRAEAPRQQQQAKKPKLFITSAGSVPLAP